MAAAALSFFVGAVVLAVVSTVLIRAQTIQLDWQAPAPWLFVGGGCLGAAFVTSATILVPRLGAAALMAFMVSGQLLAGMIIDRFSLLGVAVREITQAVSPGPWRSCRRPRDPPVLMRCA